MQLFEKRRSSFELRTTKGMVVARIVPRLGTVMATRFKNLEQQGLYLVTDFVEFVDQKHARLVLMTERTQLWTSNLFNFTITI